MLRALTCEMLPPLLLDGCPLANTAEEKEDEESGVRPLHSVYFDIPRAMSLDRRYGHILLHVPPLIVLRSSLRIMPFIFT